MLPIPDRLFHEPVVRQLLDDSPLLFVALTGTGDVTWASATTRRSLGWTDEFIARATLADLVHPDDLDTVVATMLEPVRGAWEREHLVVRVRHLAGDHVHLEFGGLDLRETDGSGVYLVWGRSHETSTRLEHFVEALGTDAELPVLLSRVLAWFEAAGEDNAASLSVRQPDGSYQAERWDRPIAEALAIGAEPRADRSGPWARAATEGVLVVHEDLGDLDLDDAARAAVADLGASTLWVLPVHTSAGSAPGALVSVWRRTPGEPRATQRRQLERLAHFVRLALDAHDTHAALVRAATTDPLTGLANRARLADVIGRDRSELAAVLFCDLDDFKVVNDRCGHLVGDQLLEEAARRLRRAIRPRDLLARLGGDEFAVYCPDLASGRDAEDVADAIIAALDVPIEVRGTVHHVGCSVGVAVVDAGRRSTDGLDQLLGEADRALYRAKAAGKGRWSRSGEATDQLPFPT